MLLDPSRTCVIGYISPVFMAILTLSRSLCTLALKMLSTNVPATLFRSASHTPSNYHPIASALRHEM